MHSHTCCRWWDVLLALACLWYVAQAQMEPVCPTIVNDGGTARCVADGSNYIVDGHKLEIAIKHDESGSSLFKIKCFSNLTLDNPALPRFRTMIPFIYVKVEDCNRPQHSYNGALQTLNVNPMVNVYLIGSDGEISREHFAGFNYMTHISLTNLRLTADAFDATPRLRMLSLTDVKLPAKLPTSLEQLMLVNTGVTRLDRNFLGHFKGLNYLSVTDKNFSVSVGEAKSLKTVNLNGTNVLLDATLPDSLVEVSVNGWGERKPTPWKGCKGLRVLHLEGSTVEVLPDGWLENCSELRELGLYNATSLRFVPPHTLRGANALEVVVLKNCGLLAMKTEYDLEGFTYLKLEEDNHVLPNGLVEAIYTRRLRQQQSNVTASAGPQ